MVFPWKYNYMSKFGQNNQGSSLIEIVIALAIFSLISTSLASLLMGSFGLLTRQSEIIQANNLANEGVEVVRFIKDNKWNNLLYDQSAINRDNGQWELTGEGTSEQSGIFGRQVNFYPIFRNNLGEIVVSETEGAILDLYSKKVEVIVNWEVNGFDQKQIRRVTYLSNWDSLFWKQNDWSGGSGQELWEDVNKYANDDGNVQASSSSLTLKEIATSTYALSAYLESSAFSIPAGGNFNIIEWTVTGTKTSECPECEIRVLIKTAPDTGDAPGDWSQTWSGPDGDDGDESDYFATSTGTLLNTDCNEKRWIKYRVEFSGNGSATPVLNEMRVNYN